MHHRNTVLRKTRRKKWNFCWNRWSRHRWKPTVLVYALPSSYSNCVTSSFENVYWVCREKPLNPLRILIKMNFQKLWYKMAFLLATISSAPMLPLLKDPLRTTLTPNPTLGFANRFSYRLAVVCREWVKSFFEFLLKNFAKKKQKIFEMHQNQLDRSVTFSNTLANCNKNIESNSISARVVYKGSVFG